MRGSRPLAIALLALAVIFALAAIFYFTRRPASRVGRPAIHWKHAIVFTVLTLLAVVAANFAGRSRSTSELVCPSRPADLTPNRAAEIYRQSFSDERRERLFLSSVSFLHLRSNARSHARDP